MYMLARVRKIFCILSISIYKESKFQSAFFSANLPSPVAVPFGLVSAVASSVQVCRGEKENKKLSRVPNAKPPFPFPVCHPISPRALEARQPTGRLVPAEEVARAICSLASPLAGSSTGTVVTVDGGLTNLRLPG
jgi:NAD(P)-dependent dehydrogenase (short-subunit alcohol dehydrogenase family)